MQKFVSHLAYRILKWCYDKSVTQTYEGIKICDFGSNHIYLIQALDLIKNRDPRRFHRIQKRLVYIVNAVCVGGAAEYHHSLKACYVDISRFNVRDEDWGILQLACTLVHEATHGQIEAHNIRYSQLNRLRIERVCHREQWCFIARVMPETDIPEFDPTGWEDYWKSTRWQHAISFLKRMQTAKSESG